jgi:hypothetical protein
MKRAEITTYIENHQKITEKEIQSLLKEHSQNIERSLIDYLKTDQEELLKDITDHRKNASIIEPRAKKQMTMKIRTINIKNTDSFDLDSFSKFVFNDFDNNKNGSEVLNEQNNEMIKLNQEKKAKKERTRQIEAIDFEQQRN